MTVISAHAADRLLESIHRLRAPVCVGLDPVVERFPAALRNEAVLSAPIAIEQFSHELLSAVAAHVPCVKVQSACYERYGSEGVAALERTIARAKELGLEVILDAKRGDISVSAAHYAAAAFNHGHADWLTLHGYLGEDSLEPFLHHGCGGFVLVRTSNAGGDQIQELRLADGRTIAEAVGDLTAALGRRVLGLSGYSALGAVVGATRPETAKRLRERMPEQIFLVPGYGAQGGGVDDVLPCFKSDGTGAIVTASRSVVYAFNAADPNWTHTVEEAAAAFADEIGRAVGWR